MTKQELINQWLKRYPEDVNHPDLEQMVLAGKVLCKDGLYRDWNDWLLRYDAKKE